MFRFREAGKIHCDAGKATKGKRNSGCDIHSCKDQYGPYREELEKLVEQYGLKDSITFKGYVSSEERDKYLRNAGIFFSGSRFEAMPIAVLEAMDAGCKVLISDIEPHRQLVTEEFIYKSLEDLKKKLRKCLTDTPDGQKYEMDQFYWKNIIEQYEDIYSQVISNKAGEI